MPMTLEELTDQLSAIEPDEGIYQGIGSSEIPLLDQVVQHPERPWMALRAVFALSRVPDSQAIRLLEQASKDRRAVVRTAVAASISNLKPIDAGNILLTLLDDKHSGVQKFAIRAVSRNHSEEVREKLRSLTATPIGNLATNKLRELDRNEL